MAMRPGTEFRDIPADYNFSFPTPEEISSMTPEKFRQVVELNSHNFLEIMQRTRVPFFGFHGASRKSVKHIMDLSGEIRGDRLLQVTTFFKRPEDPKVLLNSLYAGAKYVAPYAVLKMERESFDAPGAVVIINLQNEGFDENITTSEGEGNTLSSYDYDTEVIEEKGSALIVNYEYEKSVKGFIEAKEFGNYFNIKSVKPGEFNLESFLNPDAPSQIPDVNIDNLRIIVSQKIVYQTFKILGLIKE